ncbi:MAG: Holliday junction resolvase RuvX [Campylobacterales bacterium]|nr:Holliday junction resolvase RuvX [Campylobacterales bacterium]
MRTLAIDLGLKRIGVAYSPDGSIVTPLPAIIRRNRDQAAAELSALIAQWQVQRVVVGIPMAQQSEDEMRRRVAHFMGLVAFGGEICYEDESESSLEAEALLRGEMRYRRDGRIDSMAAMVILKRFLKI